MKINIISGYRGKPTDEAYLVPGEHDVNPALADYLTSNGHAIALETKPPETAATEVNDNLHDMTVFELRRYAKLNDISLTGITTKDEIIAAIEAD